MNAPPVSLTAFEGVPWNRAVRAVLRREWALVLARPVDLLVQALFFAAVASLPALSVAPTPATLALLAPGVLWVAALLCVLMAGWRCFHDDLRSGWLDQWLLCGVPLVLLVTARLVAQWIVTALPVLLLAPLVALQYGLNGATLGVLMLALLPGIGVLVLLVGVVAALAAGLRQGGMLVIGLVLPLAVPVLVFGSLAVRAAPLGEPAGAHLALLAGTACAMLAFCPWLAASAVRIGVES
ncbi:MAG: heme exporter protein CcmB [Burkholderiaceae bacterium]|jgi:heme exporter protein B|nr:heme exporter protein CcmB [Burkholderiaceae bacterium]